MFLCPILKLPVTSHINMNRETLMKVAEDQMLVSAASIWPEDEFYKKLIKMLEEDLGVSVDHMLVKAAIFGATLISKTVEVGVSQKHTPEHTLMASGKMVVDLIKARRFLEKNGRII